MIKLKYQKEGKCKQRTQFTVYEKRNFAF